MPAAAVTIEGSMIIIDIYGNSKFWHDFHDNRLYFCTILKSTSLYLCNPNDLSSTISAKHINFIDTFLLGLGIQGRGLLRNFHIKIHVT